MDIQSGYCSRRIASCPRPARSSSLASICSMLDGDPQTSINLNNREPAVAGSLINSNQSLFISSMKQSLIRAFRVLTIAQSVADDTPKTNSTDDGAVASTKVRLTVLVSIRAQFTDSLPCPPHERDLLSPSPGHN